jgi:Domain of unknown function (DUF1707)
MASPAPASPTPIPALAVAAPATDVRTSDGERQQVVDRIHHALGEGRLDLDEAEKRTAAAYAARYRSDLPPLLADLPDDAAPGSVVGEIAPTWTAVWTSIVWRARTTLLRAPVDEPPTARQCRSAALFTLLALGWIAVCAVLGAVVVAA